MGRGRKAVQGATRRVALERAASADAEATAGSKPVMINLPAGEFYREKAGGEIRRMLLDYYPGQTKVVICLQGSAPEERLSAPSVAWCPELDKRLRRLLGLERSSVSPQTPKAALLSETLRPDAEAPVAPSGEQDAANNTDAPQTAPVAYEDEALTGPQTIGTLRARLMQMPGNPHPELPVLGWLIDPEAKLNVTELAVADLLEQASMGGQGEDLELRTIWESLYRFWRDTKTQDVYVRDGALWRLLPGREGFNAPAPLPDEIVHRLELVNPTSKYADQLNGSPDVPPSSPDNLRTQVLRGLKASGVPIVSSGGKSPGYRIAHTRDEMALEQVSRRNALKTEVERLDAQLEMVARFSRALATGEVEELTAVYAAGSGQNADHYRAQAKDRASTSNSNGARNGRSRPKTIDAGLSFEEAIGAR